MLFNVALAVAFLPSTLGYAVTRETHEWKAPGPGDRRSPCPFVNTAANHGFLPRDGFNVSAQQIFDGFKKAVNFESSALEAAVTLARLTSTTGHRDTVHLDDLNRHNIFEHDASISRMDAYFGNQVPFDQTTWDKTLPHFPNDRITIPQAAAAMYDRIVESNATNPTFVFGAIQWQTVQIETAAYTMALGGTVDGNVRKDWVRVVFEEERFPYQEGFTKPETPVTFAMFQEYIAKLMSHVP